MRDQHALGTGIADLDMGLDGIAAAPDIRRDVGRHVAHTGMEGEMVTRGARPKKMPAQADVVDLSEVMPSRQKSRRR